MNRKYFTPATVTLEYDMLVELPNGTQKLMTKGTKVNLGTEITKLFYKEEKATHELHFFNEQPDQSNPDHFQALYYFLNFELTGKFVRVVEAHLNGKDPIELLSNA